MTVWVEVDNIIPRRYIGSGGPLFWSVKGSDLTLMNLYMKNLTYDFVPVQVSKNSGNE